MSLDARSFRVLSNGNLGCTLQFKWLRSITFRGFSKVLGLNFCYEHFSKKYSEAKPSKTEKFTRIPLRLMLKCWGAFNDCLVHPSCIFSHFVEITQEHWAEPVYAQKL